MKASKKRSDVLFDSRIGSAVLYVVACVAICALFGGLLSAFTRQSFLPCVGSVFVVFGGSFVVIAALLVFTNIDEGFAGGFGVALYWGTGIVAGLLERTIYDTGSRLFISFLLCSFVCYVAYNKCFKS